MTDATTVSTVDQAIERRLARVAKEFDKLKEERDALIVIAFIEGAGVREIARAVGMTHPAVKYILDKHAENPAIVEEQRKRDEYRRTQRFDRQQVRDRVLVRGGPEEPPRAVPERLQPRPLPQLDREPAADQQGTRAGPATHVRAHRGSSRGQARPDGPRPLR